MLIVVFFIVAHLIPAFLWGYGVGRRYGCPNNLFGVLVGLPVVVVLCPALALLTMELVDAVISSRSFDYRMVRTVVPLTAYVALAALWMVGFASIGMMAIGHATGRAIAVKRSVAHD